ncbi:calcyphosin-2 isoform X2 [Pyxicephalus adspersus]|uniref:calcyphosin-2 isoform X2 n=1 Tax=Pyxicephalus adspersus TaxID=30357 RepID=UPI003B5A5E95
MTLEIKGVAATPRGHPQPSSKSHSAKGWRSQSQAADIRPPEVPCLDLGKLGDSDDEDTYIPLSKGYPRIGPPDSSSTVSWGTPLNTPYAQHYQKQQTVIQQVPVNTELRTVPENLPSPSDRYRLKYQQYEEEMKNSYKQYTMREKARDTQHSARQKQQAGPPEEQGFGIITQMDDKVYLQQCYTSKPYSAQHSLRKMEAEDMAAQRRKQAVVEQVMIDQLSRAVISDPEQNASSSILNNPQRDVTSAPLRFKNRTLHETKIKTRSTLTENMLSHKLCFDARILCRNGRDACRELIGFFFDHDKSVTIYEYHQFGKNRTNALPFIQKGVYYHKYGCRKGKPYELDDFYSGANLTFHTVDHQSLSESLKRNPVLAIRITAVDERAMKSLRVMFEGNKCEPNVHWQDDNILLTVQDAIKEKLKNRSVRTLTGLGKHFRQLDKNGSGYLGKTEYKQALKTFHLDLSEKMFESLWDILDENSEGRVDYAIFVRALVGEMNEYRKSLVRKAFMKLDPNKTGAVSMIDVRKFYCAKKHPQVLAGSASEEEIKSAFLETLESACTNPQEVSYSEFEDYYEGLSISILSDEDFINILRNSWGI